MARPHPPTADPLVCNGTPLRNHRTLLKARNPMPFTPFHMGAGLALKAVAGRHFSVLTFGIAQVAMDIEPLVGMLRGAAVLHGPTHTYFGRGAHRAGHGSAGALAVPPTVESDGTWRYTTTARHGWLKTNGGSPAPCCSAPWPGPGRMCCSTA